MVREQDRGKEYFGKLPFAIQSFEQMREGGYKYIDKTDLIWEIAHGPLVQFFARPRRFGKSLMVSTVKSYFEGRGDLFAGLKVEEKRRAAGETEWEKHPVFFFGFSASSFTQEDDVRIVANRFLERYEQQYGLNDTGGIGDRLARLIHTAYNAGGIKPVILVDEYDNPLTDTIAEKDRALHEHYKNELRGFYKAVKECAEELRLVVITGITQFSELSLFSGINQLRNQSFDETYATLFGFTEEEMVEVYGEEIARLGERLGFTFEGMVDKLRKYYDGYRFTPADVYVYNPQSIIFAFDEGMLLNFWANTGTSRLLATVFPNYTYDFSRLVKPVRSTVNDLSRLDLSGRNPVPLLYQSGYLTILDFNIRAGLVKLAIPNREVSSAFWEVVLPLYGSEDATLLPAPFMGDLLDGNIAGAMEQFEALVAGIPYSTMSQQQRPALYEDLVQTALYAWFCALGVMVQTEVHSLKGRADAVLYLPETTYIFELKVGPMKETAADAMAQIKGQKYATPHLGKGKQVVAVGVSIDTREETRGDVEWVSEVVG
ncbi:MAG: hypothetical protein CSA97_05630 [Bacteroidetes bacterium]|nr:MAG: hypothetical protein CSA97_05630 [Bacteroidota bacterium]